MTEITTTIDLQTEIIAEIVASNHPPMVQGADLFTHYRGLCRANDRDLFVLALIGEAMAARAKLAQGDHQA